MVDFGFPPFLQLEMFAVFQAVHASGKCHGNDPVGLHFSLFLGEQGLALTTLGLVTHFISETLWAEFI